MSSGPIWQLAEMAGAVPTPADDVLALRVLSWWAMPRTFECGHVKATSAVWWVVWPRPGVLCGRCAWHLHEETTTCVYCAQAVGDADGQRVVVDGGRGVVLLCKAHVRCAAAAAGRGRNATAE